MRKIAFILIIFFEIACAQKNPNNTEVNKNIDFMKDTKSCIIPEEVAGYIYKNTVFLYSVIAMDTVDFLANTLFKLDTERNFIRINNEEMPQSGKLFSLRTNSYEIQVQEKKYEDFIKYLKQVCSGMKESNFKTPVNLNINGGVKKYVYIRSEEKVMSFCFEPESSEIIMEIEKQFDKLFK